MNVRNVDSIENTYDFKVADPSPTPRPSLGQDEDEGIEMTLVVDGCPVVEEPEPRPSLGQEKVAEEITMPEIKLGKERVDLYLPRPGPSLNRTPPKIPVPRPKDGAVIMVTPRGDDGKTEDDDETIKMVKGKSSPEIATMKTRRTSKMSEKNEPNTRASVEAKVSVETPDFKAESRPSLGQEETLEEKPKEEFHTPEPAPVPSSPPPVVTHFAAGASSSSEDKVLC